jgi:voltage-gated potassium channel
VRIQGKQGGNVANRRLKLQEKLYTIIFEADTPAGKAFDVALIISILANTLVIMAESVAVIRSNHPLLLNFLVWFFVAVFTVEYLLRVWIARNRMQYIFSFFGVVDLAAILPVYLSILFPQALFLTVVRVFRLLRLFSILKMSRYIEESGQLVRALKASRPKITVFLFTILFIVVMVGSLMYIIEGPENGFTNIPESMYWAVVTVSTVGYGDISPQTTLGKVLSSILMIIAYGIIAVPTGIVTYELAQAKAETEAVKVCPNCYSRYTSLDDNYCTRCGTELLACPIDGNQTIKGDDKGA